MQRIAQARILRFPDRPTPLSGGGFWLTEDSLSQHLRFGSYGDVALQIVGNEGEVIVRPVSDEEAAQMIAIDAAETHAYLMRAEQGTRQLRFFVGLGAALIVAAVVAFFMGAL